MTPQVPNALYCQGSQAKNSRAGKGKVEAQAGNFAGDDEPEDEGPVEGCAVGAESMRLMTDMLVILAFALPAFTQELTANQLSAAVLIGRVPGGLATEVRGAAAEPLPPSPIAQSTPKTADRTFWLLTAYQFAGAIFDVETTVRGTRPGRCYEGNPLAQPLIGRYPTRKRAYPVALGIHAGVAFVGHWLKKKDDRRGSKRWMLLPLLAGSGHVAVGLANIRCF